MWFFIIPFAIVALILIVQAAKRRTRDHSASDRNFTVTMTPVSTVYDEQQRLYRQEVISDTSNGRLIDGHPLRTREDWDRWSKYDHEAMDCADIVRRSEKELQSRYCADPDGTLNQAKEAYSRYERLCTTYGMWNHLIDDHAHYIPTADQRRRSEELLGRIASLVPEAQERRKLVEAARDTAVAYLDTCPGKTAYKTDMTRELSDKLEVNPAEAGKLIRTLYNIDVLRESKNEAGRIIVRKARKRKETQA